MAKCSLTSKVQEKGCTALLAYSVTLAYSCLIADRIGTQMWNMGLFLASHPAQAGNKAEDLRK